MTGAVEELIAKELATLGVPFVRANRGGISAWIDGAPRGRRRAFGAHIDTLGAMVKSINANGTLTLSPVGSLPARFVEGARAVVHGASQVSGTILPPKSSGHAHYGQVDGQLAPWSALEMRLDFDSPLEMLTPDHVRIGDFVSLDPQLEINRNGFINSRHLDNKAGVAVLLTATMMFLEKGKVPSHDVGLLFNAHEETGGGPSYLLNDKLDDFIGLDIGIVAENQNALLKGVTICAKDSFGPYDKSLSKMLAKLCESQDIPYDIDIFDNYFSDAKSMRDAGFDTRLALICFGCESSHGYERVHHESLFALVHLCVEAMAGS